MEKIVLHNGLRVILEQDECAKTASVGIWIASGTRFEDEENLGVSHFVEHILFKGTKKRTSFDIAETMDSIGAQFNAFTTKEYTSYYFRVLSDYLDTAADVLFDMITNPRIDQDDVELEKGVIVEEIGMYEDSADDVLVENIYGSVWQDAMIGKAILGTRDTVNAMTSQKLSAHMARFYVPERMVIAASGRFDKQTLLEKINEYFASAENTSNPITSEESKYFKSFTLTQKDFEQINLAMAFPTVPLVSESRYAFTIFNAIMGASTSSRLFQKIREDLGLAYSIGSSCVHYSKEGIMLIDMGVNSENQLKALEETCNVLKDLRDNGVTEREFSRVKQQLIASLLMGAESWLSRASNYGRSELIENNAKTYEFIAEQISKVTIEQINEIAKKYIDFSKVSAGVVGRDLKDEEQYKIILEKYSI